MADHHLDVGLQAVIHAAVDRTPYPKIGNDSLCGSFIVLASIDDERFGIDEGIGIACILDGITVLLKDLGRLRCKAIGA